MFKKCNNFKYLLIFAIVLVCLPVTSALAASKLNLYYYGTKQNVTYTGQQVKYTYNGSTINMKNTPGIIINGTSLVSFNDVFVKSAIKMNYKYDEAKGKLTLSQNGTTLVLTAGSKKATVNGKSVSLSLAPQKVKFKDQKVTKLLVPARFVAETFGYKYNWNSQTSTASITSSSMHLYYNNKNVTYSGTQGKVTIDGKAVSLGSMPSIIVDNTALLRAWKVFSASTIGASYNFNSSAKELTLSLEDTVIKLTIGSTTANVNGNSRVMDAAPLVVKNTDTGESYVMVPGSFVASCLGYDYTWNSSTKTSVITSRAAEDTNNKDDEDGPELGGDPLPGTEALNWGIATEFTEEYNKISNLTNTAEVSEDTDITANIYSILKDSAAGSNIEVYSIHSYAPFSKSTVDIQNQILDLHINNSYINSDIEDYSLDGILSDTVSGTTNYTELSADISFNLAYPNTNYELSISDDKCTLYLTLYPNYLTNITAGTKNGNDYVQITGMKDFTVDLTENDNLISLQIPNAINGIDEKYLVTALTSLQSVRSTNITGNTASIILEKSETSEYTVTQKGNTYLITFNDEKDTDENQDYDLQIKLPGDIYYSDITHEDRYYKNQIAIILPGDYRDFYNSNALESSNSVVSNISVSYKNYNTEIVISTSKLQGYKLTDLDGYIGVILGNPQDIYKNIVVLDAGHGGTDPGAIRKLNGVTINEKDINFKIMYQLTQKYFNADDSEIKAYYSRYDNTKVNLYERAAFAKKVGADLFVSLHMNANNSSSPKGTEIYYCGTNKATTANGLTSKILANMFLNSLPDKIGTAKRYVSNQNYVVVRENTVPAILIELGFMSNSSDLKLMTNSSFQNKSAKAIYDILCDVFNAYPTGR